MCQDILMITFKIYTVSVYDLYLSSILCINERGYLIPLICLIGRHIVSDVSVLQAGASCELHL